MSVVGVALLDVRVLGGGWWGLIPDPGFEVIEAYVEVVEAEGFVLACEEEEGVRLLKGV